MEFTLKLQAEQINVILAGMDELPHKAARRTIDTILQQVREQEMAAAAPQAPEADTDAGLTD